MSVIQNYYLHKVPSAASITQLQVAISVSSRCKTLPRAENHCWGRSCSPWLVLGDGSSVKTGESNFRLQHVSLLPHEIPAWPFKRLTEKADFCSKTISIYGNLIYCFVIWGLRRHFSFKLSFLYKQLCSCLGGWKAASRSENWETAFLFKYVVTTPVRTILIADTAHCCMLACKAVEHSLQTPQFCMVFLTHSPSAHLLH